MSPVDFERWQCSPVIFLKNVPVKFRKAQCHLSILGDGDVPCHYFSKFPVGFKVVQCSLSNLRKRCVTMSNLRVKGPSLGVTPH